MNARKQPTDAIVTLAAYLRNRKRILSLKIILYAMISVSFPVHTGEMLCIEGWIAIPQTLTSGVDGFMVYDNHGGIALAQRYRERTGWRPFAFYRFAAWDGEMTLTFAMSGLETVKLDDVSVRTVSP